MIGSTVTPANRRAPDGMEVPGSFSRDTNHPTRIVDQELLLLQVVIRVEFSIALPHPACMRHTIAICLIFAVPAHAAMPGVDGDRQFFISQVMQEAATVGVPPELADAVAMVETGYRPDARGSSGEVGIMQILPNTAAALGFRGSLGELFEPSVNIHLAVQYLARAWALSDGNVCRALMKYRAGLGEEVMSALSAQYCARVIAWLMGTGSKLGSGDAVAANVQEPAVSVDPYVVEIGPALAAKITPEHMQAAPGAAVAHPKRSPTGHYADFRARFDSHIRQVVNDAISDQGSDE